MSKFDFNAAETENAGQSAVEQSIYNVKTDGNKARALKATTALAGALAMGLGVAVLAPTHAQAADLDLGADGQWASDGGKDSVDIANAAAGDAVNFTDDKILSVTNDGMANDGSDTDDKNTFEIGAVTATNSGDGTVAVQAHDTPSANLAVGIAQVGATDKALKALTVDGGDAADSDTGNAATTTVAGAANVNTVTVTGGNGSAGAAGVGGASSAIFEGALTGALNITGGAGGDTNADSTVAGANGGAASATIYAGATGNITLTNGADGNVLDATGSAAAGSGGTATLNIGTGDGGDNAVAAAAQTIDGSITAAADGDGAISINNSSDSGTNMYSVTVTGDVGSSTAAIGSITQTAGNLSVDGNLSAGTYDQTAGNLTVKGNMDVTDFVHTNGDITFSGDTAQTVTVVDNGNSTAETGNADGLVLTDGDLSVTNTSTSGVTFANAITLAGTTNAGTLTVGDGTNASVATFSGDVTAADGSANVADNSTANFGGNISLTKGASGTGLLTVTGTAIISGGTDDDGDATTHNVTTLTTGAATNVAGTLKLDNTLKLGSADSDLAFATDSRLELGITTGTAIDVGASGGVTNAGAITIVAANGMQDGNQVILVNDASGLSEDDASDVTIIGGRLMDFTITDDTTNNNVVLTATSKSDAEVAEALGLSEDNAERLLAAFNNSTNSGFTNFVGDANTTDEQIALVNDQVAVQEETLSATAGAISGASSQVATITADRLASLRTGDAYGLDAEQAATGFATGDGEMNRNMWGKLFFNTASQDSVDEAAGYDSDTNGFVLGSDTEVGANMRVGGSLAITRSDIDGKGGGDAQTDVDGYQLTVYGDLTQSDYFVDWQVGASMNSVETLTEIDPASTLNSGSNSEYDTLSYLAKVGMGVPMDMGEGARLTPYGSFAFQRITSDEYSLIFPDDPGLNQTVAPDDVDELSATLGGRYTVAIETEDGGMISPQLRGALSYNFIGNTAEATSTYADGSSVIVQGVDAEKFGGSLGAGISYASDATTFGFDIDSVLKDGYASYTGALNFRLQF